MGIIDELVTAAQHEGALRADVGTGDVVYLFSVLLRSAPTTSTDLTDSAFARARAVLLDGLRASNRTPLPGSALTSDEITPPGG